MKKNLSMVFTLVLMLLVFAQAFGVTTYRYEDTVANIRGDVIGGARIYVYKADTDTLATIYSLPGTSTEKTNPTSTDTYGRFFFYANPGIYDVTISGPGITTYTIEDIVLNPYDTVTGVFNVVTYGAVGDGVTDDTDAIQDAIDACGAAGGGEVLVPTGTYFVTATLELFENGVSLVGQSSRGSILDFAMATPGDNGVEIGDPSTSGIVYNAGMRDLQLNATAASDRVGNLVVIDGTRRAWIDRCYIRCFYVNADSGAAVVFDVTGQNNSELNMISNSTVGVPGKDASGAAINGFGLLMKGANTPSANGSRHHKRSHFNNISFIQNDPSTGCPAICIIGGNEGEQLRNSGHSFTDIDIDARDGGGIWTATNANTFTNVNINGASTDTLLHVMTRAARQMFVGFRCDGEIAISPSVSSPPTFLQTGTYQGPEFPTMVYTPRSSTPLATNYEGQVYYDDSDDALKLYTGSDWEELSAAASIHAYGYLPDSTTVWCTALDTFYCVDGTFTMDPLDGFTMPYTSLVYSGGATKYIEVDWAMTFMAEANNQVVHGAIRKNLADPIGAQAAKGAVSGDEYNLSGNVVYSMASGDSLTFVVSTDANEEDIYIQHFTATVKAIE